MYAACVYDARVFAHMLTRNAWKSITSVRQRRSIGGIECEVDCMRPSSQLYIGDLFGKSRRTRQWNGRATIDEIAHCLQAKQTDRDSRRNYYVDPRRRLDSMRIETKSKRRAADDCGASLVCVCVRDARARRCCGHIEWVVVAHARCRCVCRRSVAVAVAGVDRYKLWPRYFPLLFRKLLLCFWCAAADAIVVAAGSSGVYLLLCLYFVSFLSFVSFVFFSCVFAWRAGSQCAVAALASSPTVHIANHRIQHRLCGSTLLCHSNRTDLLQSVVVLRSE